MIVGVIGVGVVGGVLVRWFKEHTDHVVRCVDPIKNMTDSLEDCSAIFISIPVNPSNTGQKTDELEIAVKLAKQYTPNVFIRSTVLPGTSDALGCIAMPEFLTERTCYEDMCRMPVLVGQCDPKLLDYLFPLKEKVIVSNTEAELAKYTHNCFGALKVTYFNIIHELSKKFGCDFEKVKTGALLTGFIEKQHTKVPGPDGQFGYGGKCFPVNVESFTQFMYSKGLVEEAHMFGIVQDLNTKYRHESDIFDSTDSFNGVPI